MVLEQRSGAPDGVRNERWIVAVYVPPGVARIGSESPDEGPPCRIELGGYWIGRHAVTNEQFGRFIQDGGYETPALWEPEAFQWARDHGIAAPAFWRDERFNAPRQPVTGVSFHEASAFAAWCGGRLPTEAEWEMAARGTDGRTYPWGEDDPDLRLANFAPDFVPRRRAPSLVTKFRRNVSPYGCRQMAGNVFEWCVDYYHFDTPRRRGGAGFVETRPSGRRVLKGGAWTTDADRIRPSARWSYTPDLRDNILGFRVVLAGDDHGR